jgi:SNF2 family DNA or RNA helicase
MYILHGTWFPGDKPDFENTGRFVLWVERQISGKVGRNAIKHPGHLEDEELHTFFSDVLPMSKPLLTQLPEDGINVRFALPSTKDGPLPSFEMAINLCMDLPDKFEWKSWRVNCLAVNDSLLFLKELHFLVQYYSDRVIPGRDIIFWYHFGRAVKDVIIRHQYIPSLLPREETKRKGRGKKGKSPGISFAPAWQIISPRYEEMIKTFSAVMPGICRAVFPDAAKVKKTPVPALYDSAGLLDHYSQQTLADLVSATPFTQKIMKSVEDTMVSGCLPGGSPGCISQDTWEKWHVWQKRLSAMGGKSDFILCFRLETAPPESPDDWSIEWLAASKKDPSLQVPLEEYWGMKEKERKAFIHQFGNDFEQALLLQFGHAGRIYARVWDGLRNQHPARLHLTRNQALEFLRESAWVLEDAGFKVMVPSWWTPEGRQRAMLRLRASSPAASGDGGVPSGYFNISSLVDYRYELSIGGEPVSRDEWQALVEAKSNLVHFRGQWMEIDREKMGDMLDLWKSQGDDALSMSLSDLMRITAGDRERDELEVALDDGLKEIMAKLGDKRLELMDTPSGLRGKLREYQKRGLSWLHYLERLGMGPCLADDMGLGKTVQVIALLVRERKETDNVGPTLLIVPTSVLGNWQKELERFAPGITCLLHHGPARAKKPKAFREACSGRDIVITSFALARMDAKALDVVEWYRIVVDEAQNIKNPESAQTRAICKLKADRRMALTGTPVENRLMDLWSIFHFLNPGYLGTPGRFKKNFEIPVQKNDDQARLAMLKRMVEPFILRRMKTDKSIISDLPDKIEQKVYCNLTKEQASLYEAVVREVEAGLSRAEGIQRKGMILSTLMRLKQICNHPSQFLQDGSEYSISRSHKLDRVASMAEEVISEGESLLLFTQFAEAGKALERMFRRECHFNTYFLYGAVSRNRREKMITEFQAPETGPSVFVLSLKAGGTGITLTKASHVFHFDRWWNPAVENQATDRAFRIGQTKKVFVHKMVTIGTLEERIDQMLEEKQRLAESITGSDESWLTELDDQAFRELITLSRDAVLE